MDVGEIERKELGRGVVARWPGVTCATTRSLDGRQPYGLTGPCWSFFTGRGSDSFEPTPWCRLEMSVQFLLDDESTVSSGSRSLRMFLSARVTASSFSAGRIPCSESGVAILCPLRIAFPLVGGFDPFKTIVIYYSIFNHKKQV
jgi:hypothetical protein